MTRTCGDCTACCTALGVLELEKPEWKPCDHLGCAGCSIYERRPQSCRDWTCTWLNSDPQDMADNLRPDLCGLILEGSHWPDGESLMKVWQLRDRLPFRGTRLLERLRKGVAVYLIKPNGRTVLGPPDAMKRFRARLRRAGISEDGVFRPGGP